jgi:hypothetical protein
MEIPIKDKRIVKIKGMVKVNIFMLMEVIIMEIGLKIKCAEMESYIMMMDKLSMMDNGNKICLKEEEFFMVDNATGINTKDNLKMDK